MISGLSLEYAHARLSARMSQRPDERLWQQARSARSVPALLEAVRSSPAAPMVSGIPASGDADAIELAFRQQLRTRVDEVASWCPDDWRGTVGYTRHLPDLPALLQLLADEPPPRWIANDPELAPYAAANLAQREAALAAGPLAPLAAAARTTEEAGRGHDESMARALRRLRAGPALHRTLAAWESEWRAGWPRVSEEVAENLNRLVQAVRTHLLRFGAVALDDAASNRQALAARLASFVHRAATQPVALFAYLALFALDIERLRGEFVVRARLRGASS
jgi:hypothetical protein